MKLATRDELSQQERKALRRRKKRIRKRRTAERDGAERLRAKLQPGGAAAKRLETKAAEKVLADAKRTGRVVDGNVARSSSASSSNRAGAQYTRSAQFFRNMQDGGGVVAGKKRPAPGSGGDEPVLKGARFKL